MFLEVNGNCIYYVIHGNGIPIITLHGHGVDHNIMKGFIEKFICNDAYKRIYFDLPGFGKSKITRKIKNADKMYKTIKHFIEEIIGNEKYILIGLSYGGYLLRKLIKDDPDKILGAMFVCPFITKTVEEHDALPKHKIMHNEIIDKDIIESDVYKEFAEIAVFATMESLKAFEENIYSGIKICDKEFSETYYKNGYKFSENIDNIENPFSKPVLFVMGRQDHWVFYKDLDIIIQNYPRASICVIDEGGHNVEYEKPEMVEVFALDWLAQIERNKKTV